MLPSFRIDFDEQKGFLLSSYYRRNAGHRSKGKGKKGKAEQTSMPMNKYWAGVSQPILIGFGIDRPGFKPGAWGYLTPVSAMHHTQSKIM